MIGSVAAGAAGRSSSSVAASALLRAVSIARARPAVPAGLWFALLAALLLRDAVLRGEVLSPATSLYLSDPFSSGAPRRSEQNNLLADVPFYFQPMLDLVRDTWRSGHMPLWNPYIMSGAPLLGDAQSSPFSPVMVPVWLLPFAAGVTVAGGLKIWLAGFGTWLLCRKLGLNPVASLVAGTAFCLSAFQVVWLGHAHTNVTCLLPWLFFAIEAVLARPSVRSAVGLAVALAGVALGGHPESAALVVLAACLYFALRLTSVAHSRRVSAARFAFGGLLLGAALGAIAVLPFVEALKGSVDGALRGDDVGRPPGASLLTLAFPDYWGRPTGAEVPGPANFNERTFYVGAVTLVLAACALASAGVVRRYWALAVLGAVALLACTEAGTLGDLLQEIPLLGHAALGRLHVVFALAACVLAGAGIEQLSNGRRPRRRQFSVLGLAAVPALLALAIIAPSPGELVDAASRLPRRALADSAAVTHATAVLWWLVLVAALGGVVTWAVRTGAARYLAPAVLVLVAIDMLVFADGFQPTIPRDQFFSPVPASIRFLQEHQGDDRVTARFASLPPNTGQYFGLRDIRGKEHPKPVATAQLFKRFFNERQNPLGSLGVAEVDGPAHTALSMMSVKYLLQSPQDPRPRASAWKLAYFNDDAAIYENRRVIPRAYVPGALRAFPTARVFDVIATVGFQPKRVALVDPTGAPKTVAGVRGTARIVSERSSRVEIDATLDRRGGVVLSDSYAPGWRASVDGKDAPVFRANGISRGVMVPAGEHRITWSYRPEGVVWGAVISGAALVGLLISAGLTLRRRRSRSLSKA